MDEENGLLPFERHQYILSRLQTHRKIRVNDLSEELQVSVLTVRRDLAALEADGLLERCRGGAVLPGRKTIEMLYDEKRTLCLPEKEKIGIRAAQTVADHETVFINSGSTTKEVIRALNGRPVRIVTTNVDAVSVLSSDRTELILLGGSVRLRSMSTVGAMGLREMGLYFPDRVIVGCDAFSLAVGLTAPTETEAVQTHKMIVSSRGPVTVVADHSKIGLISPFKAADLAEITQLITDSASEELLDPEALANASVQLILV